MIRLFARCASALLVLAALGCGARATDPPRPPAEGVMLLSLQTGALAGQRSLGGDPLAVTLAPGGRTAYVADNDLGDVFALSLPALRQVWRTHVGGGPSGLLVHGSDLFVSQYEAGQVAELDLAGGRLLREHATAPHPGELAWQDTFVTSGDHGFGIAVDGGQAWTADKLPSLGGKVFWMAPGRPGELLVTAEGSPEDTAKGAVVSVETATGRHTVLLTPRDPDQVERLGDRVYVAAHGDREVIVLHDGKSENWAQGAEVVALAPDAGLGLLMVITDAAE